MADKKIKFYGYSKCSSCQKAQKFLETRCIAFTFVDISISPPTKSELKTILKSNQVGIKNLFNTSGKVYRNMNLKAKVDQLTQQEALDLLSNNGMLVKRPIVIESEDRCSVGFNEDSFQHLWGK